MPHSVALIATLATGFGLAVIFGFIAVKLRLPALVGYLVAGIVIGPTTPGFVADLEIAGQLAEIGVMLLMFGVGLHFSMADLLSVRKIALPGAVVQMTVATAMGAALATWWGWPVGGAIVFGLSLSVASTVVLLKALESEGAVESMNGRIAIGWLVVEDLAMVLVLVLLPALAGVLQQPVGQADWSSILPSLAKTLAAVAAFVILMLVVGRRVFPWVLWQVARTGSRELFTLAVVAAAVSIAFGSAKLFGVSFALGAFFAGMVLRESEFSHRAATETLPLQDAFSVLFFVSVGMLFDPHVLIEQPWRVVGVVGVIVVGKSLAAAALVLLLRYPLNTALTVSASLAQIGEFSFILAGLGMSLGLLPKEGQSLILAGALISIALNPLLFSMVGPAQRWILARSAMARAMARRDDPLAELPMSTERKYLSRQVVLVGHGRLGKMISQELGKLSLPLVVVDSNRELIERLRSDGQPAVCGDALEEGTLIQAHIADARMLIIATPQAVDVRPMIEIARLLNPSIEVVTSTGSEEEARWLTDSTNLNQVFMPYSAMGHAMAQHVLGRLQSDAQAHGHGHTSGGTEAHKQR